MPTKPLAVSLFSGAGGFDWGFHLAGFQTQIACEQLEEASKTIAKNLQLNIVYPNTNNIGTMPSVIHGDVQEVDFASIAVNPDVLIGGPPCQDFSMAQGAQRPGLNGGRGKLYVEFVRALMFLQPKIFVFENVPGLVSANDGLAYSTILNDVKELEQKRNEALLRDDSSFHAPTTKVEGYQTLFSGVVDTTKLGVPQTRKRLIIIGLREDLAQLLSKSLLDEICVSINKALNGHSMLFSKFPLTCLEILEGKTLVELEEKYQEIMLAYRTLLRGPRRPAVTNWKSEVWSKLKFKIEDDYFSANQIGKEHQNQFDRAMEDHHNLLAQLSFLEQPVANMVISDSSNNIPYESKNVVERMHRIPPDENYAFVDGTNWAVAGHEISFIYRRTAPLKPASTVLAYGGGGTRGYHYDRSRSQLTLRERARIQTFTDDFLFEGGVSEMRAQIGEAVPPLLGQQIGTILKQVLNNFGNPEKQLYLQEHVQANI